MVEWQKGTDDSETAVVHSDYPIMLEVRQPDAEALYRGYVHIADAKIKSDRLMSLEQAKVWAVKRFRLFLKELGRAVEE